MNYRKRLSRRTVLRGLGASIALPLLDAMRPQRLWPPARTLGRRPRCAWHFCTSPTACTCQAGRRGCWDRHSSCRRSSSRCARSRSEILVLSGLTLNPARALGDGGGDHARAMASFLTGRHPRKTDGADLRAGVSVDQVAATADRPAHPISVARNRLRRGQERRRMRPRL